MELVLIIVQFLCHYKYFYGYNFYPLLIDELLCYSTIYALQLLVAEPRIIFVGIP